MSTPASGQSLSAEEIAAAFAEPADAPWPGTEPIPNSPRSGLPRAVDVVIAGLALVLLSPLLLIALIALAVASPGPILFRQSRVGRGGESFELIKLRTMTPGSAPVGVGTAVGQTDDRVTAVGRILRRSSIDELPNLINVLRGEMAIVGPRPTIPSHLDHYSPRQHHRHDVRPGMTGWAQVNGRAGLRWGERIEFDLYYVANRSAGLDLKIIGRTISSVATGRGLDPG